MAKKDKRSPTPAQIVQRAKPGWKVVEIPAADAARRVAAETSSPEMDDLRRKYLGPNAPRVPAAARNSPTSDVTLVQVEPRTPTDSRVGRKVVVVGKKGIVGEQG